MKDAAPRIFRSLERNSGQQEFDTVVAAAVSAYGSLRNPSQNQAEDLSRLVLPLWNRVTADTRRNLAASLSHARRVPRALVDLMISAPIEVSAPFLVSSPVLSPDDLARLANSGDERIARLVANRLSCPEAPAAQTAAPAASPGAMLALVQPSADAARHQIASPSLAADFLAVTPMMLGARAQEPGLRSAAGVRETLRRLALTGRSTGAEAGKNPPSFADLLSAAMDRDDAQFYAHLSETFGLSDDTLNAIVEDAGGERLAVALKALKASSADAMSVLMLLKPSIGLDVAAFDAMTRFYKALKPEDCRSMISASRQRTTAVHRPLTADETPREIAQPRPQFGRRKERPMDRSA